MNSPSPINSKATPDEIHACLSEWLEKLAGVPPERVTADARFVEDLGLDSLAMLELMMDAEDRFGIKIDDADLANLTTVGALITHLQSPPKQS
ncbi:acyl carrier protein [Synechococcus sp. ATX 2A4]|uniref:acyl carrier protein n=1 Tax=Synechococcus sp. ATX 2A4 TaxID=2823727 RepID=UPI0020CCC727|nr:acyl carrier protein [Synechococcus sp. ATX 2A4]MCP9884374.1 acyl carrier protein [Synechococcus sp. ATX 2A4]